MDDIQVRSWVLLIVAINSTAVQLCTRSYCTGSSPAGLAAAAGEGSNDQRKPGGTHRSRSRRPARNVRNATPRELNV